MILTIVGNPCLTVPTGLVNTLGGEPSTVSQIGILHKITIFHPLTPGQVTVNRWGVRECVVGVTAINAPVLRPMFTKAFWRGQPRRDVGRAMEDRLAHLPQANLLNRGYYKDSILGWIKSMTMTGKTWVTTGTTAITQATTRQKDEERPRNGNDVVLEDRAVPTSPSSTLPIHDRSVSHDLIADRADGFDESFPIWDRTGVTSSKKGSSMTLMDIA